MAFDPDAYLAQKNQPFDPDAYLSSHPASPAKDIGQRVKEIGLSSVTGANALVPGLLGLPMDTARNLGNLGIAATGLVKGMLPKTRNPAGVADAPNLPEPIGPLIGDSEWMRNKLSGLMGTDIFSPVDPSDPAQVAANIAGTVTSAGLISPSAGIKQSAGNVAKMIPSAIGAGGANLAFPDQPLAPVVGAMAIPSTVAGAAAVKQSLAPKPINPAFTKFRKAGLVIPPSRAAKSKGANIAEGVAGQAALKQQASLKNQPRINQLAKQDIGMADDVALDFDSLAAIRAQKGAIYEQAKGFGVMKADKTYQNTLRELAKPTKISKSFPGAMKKDVSDLVKVYAKKQIDAESAVEASKQLRKDASGHYQQFAVSGDTTARALGNIERKLADALDDLLARNSKNQTWKAEFKQARQDIAKTHQIEKTLKGASEDGGFNVDGAVLARRLGKDPLSGNLKLIAEFDKRHPESAKVAVPQVNSFRLRDVAGGIIGGAAGDTASSSATLATIGAGIGPAARKALLSKAFQNKLARLNETDISALTGKPITTGADLAAAISIIANQDED